MPRILFVTTKIGFGHERVSHILADAIRDSFSGCLVKTTTYFDYFPRGFQNLINRLYIYGLKWFPKVFGYIYLAQRYYKGSGVDFWSRFLGNKYARLIKSYSPDLIIITQGLACQWLGRLKKNGQINAPLVAIITDFIVHPFWISPQIDLYVVANEDMKHDLVLRVIDKDKIISSGIPIDPNFAAVYDRDKIRDKLRLDKQREIILIMGGGWGLGGIEKVLPVIDDIDISLQILVVTGKNRQLYRRLKNTKFNKTVHIYGKIDNIPELMTVSDLIITKSGGVTVSEILASGLPAIIWDIIPGQEEANAEFLLKNGVGFKAGNIDEIGGMLKVLITSEDVRRKMHLNAARLGKPDSTRDAVAHIGNLIHV